MIKTNMSKNLFWGALLLAVFLLPRQSAAITEDERNNIAVYEKVADGVVNVTSTAVQMDFFFNAFPTQGSGSGSIIEHGGSHFDQSPCGGQCAKIGSHPGERVEMACEVGRIRSGQRSRRHQDRCS